MSLDRDPRRAVVGSVFVAIDRPGNEPGKRVTVPSDRIEDALAAAGGSHASELVSAAGRRPCGSGSGEDPNRNRDDHCVGQTVRRCPGKIMFGLPASPGFFCTSASQPPATPWAAAMVERVSPL